MLQKSLAFVACCHVSKKRESTPHWNALHCFTRKLFNDRKKKRPTSIKVEISWSYVCVRDLWDIVVFESDFEYLFPFTLLQCITEKQIWRVLSLLLDVGFRFEAETYAFINKRVWTACRIGGAGDGGLNRSIWRSWRLVILRWLVPTWMTHLPSPQV